MGRNKDSLQVKHENEGHKMKSPLLILAGLLLTSIPAVAQDTPIVEVFGGFSYARVDLTQITHVGTYGWSASATENLNRWFGGTLEANGYYATPQFVFAGTIFNPQSRVYTVLYGPRFSYRRSDRINLFAQVLIGAAFLHGSQLGYSASDTSLAIAPGGGIDVGLSKRLAIRFQADYAYTQFHQFQTQFDPSTGITHLVLTGPRIRQNNIRVSTGLVLRFGKKGVK
jgi:hypothetical protein